VAHTRECPQQQHRLLRPQQLDNLSVLLQVLAKRPEQLRRVEFDGGKGCGQQGELMSVAALAEAQRAALQEVCCCRQADRQEER
jgi:hypothetical protein